MLNGVIQSSKVVLKASMQNNIPSQGIFMDEVSYAYGSAVILKNISFTLNKNEKVVIIGPSGCGKTTLLNILSGYYKASSGAIHTKGIVKTVYQQGSLFPWLTVFENIGMGLRGIKNESKRKEEIKELISLVRMEGFENYYPHQLSGGMKQRVELGRVLAGESDIILMDEPFSSLDYQARIKMRKELINLLAKRPKTLLMVTHDIDEAVQIADRILILSKRPASICYELMINVPHTRCTTHPKLIEAIEIILEKLEVEV